MRVCRHPRQFARQAEILAAFYLADILPCADIGCDAGIEGIGMTYVLDARGPRISYERVRGEHGSWLWSETNASREYRTSMEAAWKLKNASRLVWNG